MENIIIISNGTPQGTELYFDGELVSNVRSIDFKCDVNDIFAEIKVGYAPYKEEPNVTANELIANIEAAQGKRKAKNDDETINKTI